jgi:hypothetical protein
MSYLLVSPAPVDADEFITWVVREGGVRASNNALEGVFCDDWSVVWLWPDNEPKECGPVQIARLALALGSRPRLFIWLDGVGPLDRREQLFLRVVTQIMARWNACLVIAAEPDVILTLRHVQALADEESTLLDAPQKHMNSPVNTEAVELALGKTGQPPAPLATGLIPAERDDLLRDLLSFPDRYPPRDLPTGELADWALVLIGLDKDATVRAAVAAVEAAFKATPAGGADADFVREILAELQIWLDSAKGVADLRRLGNLWWSLVRNPPPGAETPLADAADMAWWVAGYEPEGWGDPPEDPEKLASWLREAADNRAGIVDVFSLVMQAVGPEHHAALVEHVRAAVAAWLDTVHTRPPLNG